MSWPTDDRPRFIVVRVDGWPESASGTAVQQSSFYILDRAFCHRKVWSARTEDYLGRASAFVAAMRLEKTANEKAAEWNGVQVAA